MSSNGSGQGVSFLAKWGSFLAVVITAVGAYGYGLIYMATLRSDLDNLTKNVFGLNTPLSQRVYSIEARVAEIARIQSEVRTKLDSLDSGGTLQDKILKRDLEGMRSDIHAVDIRAVEALRRSDDMMKTVITTTLRIEQIMELLAPHRVPGAKK